MMIGGRILPDNLSWGTRICSPAAVSYILNYILGVAMSPTDSHSVVCLCVDMNDGTKDGAGTKDDANAL